MACPVSFIASNGGTGGFQDCNGQGRCVTLHDAGKYYAKDTFGESIVNDYGANPSNSQTWDAHMIQGCLCDSFGFSSQGQHNISGFTGYDCRQRSCKWGDNMRTHEATNTSSYEVQNIYCQASGGSFTLSFRGESTVSLDFNATLHEVTIALQDVSTVGRVKFGNDSYNNLHTPLCSTYGSFNNITFLSQMGDAPNLKIDAKGLWGANVETSVDELIKGNKENAVCSNHGTCNEDTGLCECFAGWSSSNGDGDVGVHNDCGYTGKRTKYAPRLNEAEVDAFGMY